MRKSWWKILGVLLLVYTFIAGLLIEVPRNPQLEETIRNLFFHVCMWFGMMILFIVSFVRAIMYLRTSKPIHDIASRQYAGVGILFGSSRPTACGRARSGRERGEGRRLPTAG